MLGKEVRLLPELAKEQPLFGVSWFYPNTYSVGMAGLGYQHVWSLLERDADVLVRRGFTDVQEPHSEESELFGFTVAWELDFINILALLERNSIAPSAAERGDSDPLVFGGGPVLTANPEPFSDLFDLILLGDAEATIALLLQEWKRIRQIPDRRERLFELAQLPGIYVPSMYEVSYSASQGPIAAIKPVDDRLAPLLSKQLFMPPPEYVAHSVLLAPDTTWGDLFLVEVVRSCPQECRFCLASFLTRPFRAANVDTLLDVIDTGLKYTKNIGLLGPSVTEHPQFDQLAHRLKEREGARISIASVRADSLTENILSMLKKLGQKSVTIAIESGSERLRAIMKKNLSESQIKHAVDLIEAAGLKSVKFYGIVGLPHETQEDLDETVRLMKELKKTHKQLRFVFGVSSFVPKAQTPFQWSARDRDCADKLEYIRKNLSRVGIEVRPESHNWSDIQALISRGDRRLAPVLREVARQGGKIGAWKRAMRKRSQDCPGMDYYVFRQIPLDETLPWTHLTQKTRTDYLEKHLAGAADAAQTQLELVPAAHAQQFDRSEESQPLPHL